MNNLVSYGYKKFVYFHKLPPQQKYPTIILLFGSLVGELGKTIMMIQKNGFESCIRVIEF